MIIGRGVNVQEERRQGVKGGLRAGAGQSATC